MKEYILLLPIIFIIHDMEEVVGLFISLTAHFFIHIGQAIYLKKYIPSFATSVIGLPVSILILIKCTAYISFDN